MKKKKVLITIALVIATLGLIAAAAVSYLKAEKTETGIKMTDGTTLSTTLFVPKGKGPFPTVLVRTPYNKSADEWMGQAFNIFRIAVVIQDVRGKYKSGGEFYPFRNERNDGLETLRWIRKQKWSDGTVAGWGGSYLGYTQWAVSDSLDFMTLLLTGANLYDFTYPDSLFSLQTALIWGSVNNSGTAVTLNEDSIKSKAFVLPVSLADDSAGGDAVFYNDWLIHDKYDSYWQEMDHRGRSKAPALTMAGWYDIFLKTQIRDYLALEESGIEGNRLVIGPWAHGSLGEPNEYGGLEKSGDPKLIFKYVRRHIKGKKDKLSQPLHDTPINLFIMERNEYIGSDVWPPKATEITPYYIGPGNYLSEKVYSDSGNLSFTYNPANPFMSLGGTALGSGVGPARQNPNTGRTDQLVFEKTVGDEPLILLGPLSATLWISSSAKCTDFIVALQDVFPDGRTINIQEGGAKVKPVSGNPEKTEISVWATGYQVNPGHKLRVVISSSWFPRYNRSLNNCEPAASAVSMSEAIQTVWYGPGAPSSVNLPIYRIQSSPKQQP